MMVQPIIIRNGIGYSLIRLQCSLASTKNIGTMAYVDNHILSRLATLVAYSSSRVKVDNHGSTELLLEDYNGSTIHHAVNVFVSSASPFI